MPANRHLRRIGPVLLAVGIGSIAAQAHATDYEITDFTKTNNIYTNLNEQYPATGTGVPGSGVGTPNQSFIFNPQTYTSPNSVAGANQTTNGVVFDLTSDAAGHDFTEIDNLPSQTLTIPVSVSGANAVHFLINGYDNPSANFTFTGSGGATETFTGVALHDFNGGPPIRNYSQTYNGNSTPNFFDQTAFQVTDVGAGGTGNSTNGDFNTYDLDEDTFLLSPAFAGQTLDSISITSNGYNAILLGVTVTGAAVNSTPEPGSVALLAGMGVIGSGLLARRRRK